MPTNHEARSIAMRQRNAIVMPYVQSEGNCDGTVSWWMRNRLQNKSIWRTKYFTRIHNVENYLDEPEGRFVATDHYEENVKQGTDKGLEKSRQLQLLFYGTGADRQYITNGIRFDKPDKEPKSVARFVGDEGPLSISDFADRGDNCNNIGKSFIRASLNKYVVKYSVTSTTAHALGLDCLESPRLRYFDPNIGEIIFSNVAELIKWWRYCYQNRAVGGGAFGIMMNMFKAEFYERLDSDPGRQIYH